MWTSPRAGQLPHRPHEPGAPRQAASGSRGSSAAHTASRSVAVGLNRPDRRARKGLDRERTDAQVAAWRREREERGVPALPAPCAPAKQAGAGGADRSALESFVVSRYLERPLLLGGRKFDLRIYALVLSFQPLRAYLHRYPLAAWRPYISVAGMLRLDRVCAHAALRQPLRTCAYYCSACLACP